MRFAFRQNAERRICKVLFNKELSFKKNAYLCENQNLTLYEEPV